MPPLNVGLWPDSSVGSCGWSGGAGKPKLIQASCIDHSNVPRGFLCQVLGIESHILPSGVTQEGFVARNSNGVS